MNGAACATGGISQNRPVKDTPTTPPSPQAPKVSFASRFFGYDVFISFALGGPPRGSQSYASDLARRLRERDLSVFFSEDEARPAVRHPETCPAAVEVAGGDHQPRHARGAELAAYRGRSVSIEVPGPAPAARGRSSKQGPACAAFRTSTRDRPARRDCSGRAHRHASAVAVAVAVSRGRASRAHRRDARADRSPHAVHRGLPGSERIAFASCEFFTARSCGLAN